MGASRKYSGDLRGTITAILSGTVTREQVNDIISLSHAFALILLRKKLTAGKLNLSLIHLDLHDLAYDCIADLFRMDDDHTLIQLSSYFGSLPLHQLSDVQMVDHLRRIVFSKVNQGIFRIYFEHDPSLGKILRNIRITVQTLHTFIETDRFGESLLVPSFIDP
ncbi:MAG: hypothetical protein WCW40_02875, partial [Bacteroidota bacterium]